MKQLLIHPIFYALLYEIVDILKGFDVKISQFSLQTGFDEID